MKFSFLNSYFFKVPLSYFTTKIFYLLFWISFFFLSGHFPFFTVKVYNTSEENFQRKGHLEGGTTCYQYTNSILQETKIQVTCDGSPVGNLIRLQLYSKLYQLVLCDFRLYGGKTFV